MIQLSSALLEPQAPAPHGSEPPGHPPDTPFSAVLDDHQARTAVAEGHQQKRQDAASGAAADGDGREPAIDGERRDADADAAATDPAADGSRDGDRAKPADPTASDASALAALLGGVPLPAGVKLTAAAIAPAAQGDASAPAALPGAAAASAAAAPVAPLPTGPNVPAAATALPLRPPVPAAPGAEPAPGATPGTGAEAAGEQPVPSTAAARATRLADVLRSATARAASAGATAAAPAAADAATPPAATVAGAAGRSSGQTPGEGAANGSAPQQPAVPVPAQPAAAAPAQSGTPVASVAPTHGVGLEHAVETVRLALRAAADRGVTHARISLTPRELGAIEVHLRQTADGLVARVVAEHATAAQLLHDAGGELRRQLESQGLTLLRLDIGASGEQGGRAADRQALADAFADGDAGGRTRGGADSADPLAPLDTNDQTSTTTTLALPNGALVDVLA